MNSYDRRVLDQAMSCFQASSQGSVRVSHVVTARLGNVSHSRNALSNEEEQKDDVEKKEDGSDLAPGYDSILRRLGNCAQQLTTIQSSIKTDASDMHTRVGSVDKVITDIRTA